MNYVAGIDVGSRTTKCVVLDADEAVVGKALVETGAFLAQAAERALTEALRQAGLDRDDLAYIASTGWGRYQVAFRDIQITDITCHARGAVDLFPNTRTVLDIGAQNTRAIRVEPSGRVAAFRTNNRCAAGAGRFLERTATALEVGLDEIGPMALRSKQPEKISSICAVMAESEVINLVSHEARVEDILAGVHRSLVERIVSLVRQVGAEPALTLTGGVSQNVGMVEALREYLGMEIQVSPMSPFAGALGAGLLGWLRLRRRRWVQMPAGVRALSRDDAARIAQIEATLTGESPRSTYWTKKLEAYLESGEPAFGVERDGKLVGYMLGYLRGREFGLADRIGWVEFLGVDPMYQGQGLGRILMETILQYFRASGVDSVYTLVPEEREDLKAFFGRFGLAPAPVRTLCLAMTRDTEDHTVLSRERVTSSSSKDPSA